MTPEQQRIAIAEVCGWKQPFGSTGDWERPDGSMTRACGVPNYLNDLNACHAMEKHLPHSKREVYEECLNLYGTGVFSTPSERVEAFLRVLNLWTE